MMLFGISRIICFGILAIVIWYLMKKNKIVNIKIRIIIFVVLTLICSASFLWPVENLFIKFKSPESVFSYTCSGKIQQIVYGENSCLIYYSKGNSVYSYSFVLKSEDGYKISSYFDTKNISSKFDKTGSFDVYQVLGTDDYYLTGMTGTKEKEVDIVDSNNKKINYIVLDNGSVDSKNIMIYDSISNFNDNYYLFINGEKVQLTE